MEESDDSRSFSELFELQYDPITPFITHLNTVDDDPEQMDPYTPIFGSEREDFDPKFQIPNGVDATVSSVLDLFLPDSLLDRWVSATNAYAESKLSRKRCKRVSRSHAYQAFVFHVPVFAEEFHTSFQPTDLDDIINDGADEADDSFFDEETVDEQEEHLEDVEQADEVEMPNWYHKIQGFVDHINAVSKRLCKNPGSVLSIDEMMKRFKGRSNQTHRMQRSQ
ncbi:transposase IS4 [Nitzschia inconspicua]|uniref:Transposase IS4 n=1 Tax=Nitzschia inconspicua TaxID=303405 RepID=A0A9K3KBS4_9STRA|nr:transposase IS4 [Nitzschia inconspicua]